MRSEKLSLGKKIASIAGIVVATALLIVVFSGRFCNPDNSLGYIRFANFFVGSFGMAFYGMMASVIIACACALAGKTIKMPVKYVIHFILMFVVIVMIVHMLTTTYLPMDFNSHMSYLYHYYDGELIMPSFGGVVFGLLVWCLKYPLTVWGAGVVLFSALAWTVYVAGDFFYKYSSGKLLLNSKPTKADIEPTEATAEAKDKPVYDPNDERVRNAYEILFTPPSNEETVKPEVVSTQNNAEDNRSGDSRASAPSSQRDAEDILFSDEQPSGSAKGSSFWKPSAPVSEEDDYIVKGYYQKAQQSETKAPEASQEWKVTSPPAEEKSEPVQQPTKEEPVVETPRQAQSKPFAEMELDDDKDEVDITDVTAGDDYEDDDPFVTSDRDAQASRDEFVVEETKEEKVDIRPSAPAEPKNDPQQLVVVEGEERVDGGMQVKYDFVTEEELEKSKSVHRYLEYNIPPLDILNDVTIVEDHDNGERERLAQAIVNKLAVFNIKIELADIIVGPSVTRYMFTVLSQKTRMGDFKQYSDDIKGCVEAQDDIIIEAPVKGTNMIGIEVANKVKRPVVLRELLESRDFKEAKGDLIFAIGKEITGKVVLADLAKMPHLLVAGTTGSGKSVCLNCLIVSLIYRYGPEYLRFIMVDPKFVELSRYDGIPHMLTSQTITAMPDALAGMDYLINEMESRYQLFRQNGVDKISEYNSRINPKITQKLPYLIFVVDELADLMATNKTAFEGKLVRLAQKGRAAGIHIVLATQRPDVKVITGTIKANLPCRMALKVSSTYDSQTIINGGGAEKLLGYGDMLFMNSTGTSELTRVQGAYISNDEIRALVTYSKESNEVYYDMSISDEIFVSAKEKEEKRREEESSNDEGSKDELYPYYKKALRYWLERNNGKASISSIQRGINVGFNRAGRIMENLQRMGYVEELSSSETSNRALKVLVTLEELDSLFPDVDDD